MTAVLEQSALAIPLDPSLEAHEPPEVWGRGRDDVRLLVSNGDTDVEHVTFRDLPRMLRAGDARREHVGDDPGRDRRHAARRPRCASTSPPRCPAASGSSKRASRSATRRSRSSTTSPAPTSRSRVAATCTSSSGSPIRAGCGSRRRISTRACSSTWPVTASRFATSTRPASGRSSVPADLRRRAGQRGDAERVASVHGRDRRRPRAAGASRSCRSSCTRVSLRSKLTRCRTPSATASPTRRPRTSTPCTGRSAA